MSQTQACASQRPAGRLLNYAPGGLPTTRGVLAALQQHRLPTYQDLRSWLDRLQKPMVLAELYSQLFGVPAPTYQLAALQSDLMDRVRTELFPVDVETAMDMMYDGESLLEIPLLIHGCAVPWEVIDLYDLDVSDRPMIAALVAALGNEVYTLDGADFAPEDLVDAVGEWWTDRGYPEPPELTWLRNREVEGMANWLRQLPPPLDGLVGSYYGVIKADNPFWYWPDGCLIGDYVEDGYEWGWNLADIRQLSRFYQEARADMQRMDAYMHWYRSYHDAEAVVIAILVGLEQVHQDQRSLDDLIASVRDSLEGT